MFFLRLSKSSGFVYFLVYFLRDITNTPKLDLCIHRVDSFSNKVSFWDKDFLTALSELTFLYYFIYVSFVVPQTLLIETRPLQEECISKHMTVQERKTLFLNKI
jgi:hypothetical protein